MLRSQLEVEADSQTKLQLQCLLFDPTRWRGDPRNSHRILLIHLIIPRSEPTRRADECLAGVGAASVPWSSWGRCRGGPAVSECWGDLTRSSQKWTIFDEAAEAAWMRGQLVALGKFDRGKAMLQFLAAWETPLQGNLRRTEMTLRKIQGWSRTGKTKEREAFLPRELWWKNSRIFRLNFRSK